MSVHFKVLVDYNAMGNYSCAWRTYWKIWRRDTQVVIWFLRYFNVLTHLIARETPLKEIWSMSICPPQVVKHPKDWQSYIQRTDKAVYHMASSLSTSWDFNSHLHPNQWLFIENLVQHRYSVIKQKQTNEQTNKQKPILLIRRIWVRRMVQ